MFHKNKEKYLSHLAGKAIKLGFIVVIGTNCKELVGCLLEVAIKQDAKLLLLDCFTAFSNAMEELENLYSHFNADQKFVQIKNDLIFIDESSPAVAENLVQQIDFLFIDSGMDGSTLSSNIQIWGKYVRPGGLIVFGAANSGGIVDRTIDKLIYFNQDFVPVQGRAEYRSFMRQHEKLKMILCSGLQSGGTTLVSWCFLQRPDMSGTLDMWSEGILLMPYVDTRYGWCKMTTSCFRWQEVAEFYKEQGWSVQPLIVVRDVRSAYASIITKPYGVNGTTAADPPLRIRFKRFLSDWEEFRKNGWPIISFESFISNPQSVLKKCCQDLGIEWNEDMLIWPKNPAQIDGLEFTNKTFQRAVTLEKVKGNFNQEKAAISTVGIAEADLNWLENTFSEYNRINNYPAHAYPHKPSALPGRPTYFLTQHSKINREIASLKKNIDVLHDRIKRLNDAINKSKSTILELNIRLSKLNTEAEAYKFRLENIQSSYIWKLTYPIRVIYNYIFDRK